MYCATKRGIVVLNWLFQQEGKMTKKIPYPFRDTINIDIVGPSGQGKSTLASAITKYNQLANNTSAGGYESTHDLFTENPRGIKISVTHSDFKAGKLHLDFADLPTAQDHLINQVTGLTKANGTVLVLSVDEAFLPETRSQLQLLRHTGSKPLSIYLNQKSGKTSLKTTERIKKEIRVLLTEYGFDPVQVPIVSGSALSALNANNFDPQAPEYESIKNLIDNLIAGQQKKEAETGSPFKLKVEEVISGEGEKTTLQARVQKGTARNGDRVEIPLEGGLTYYATIQDLSNISEEKQHSHPDVVRLTLNGIKKDFLKPDTLIITPDSLHKKDAIDALVYLLPGFEKGSPTPFAEETEFDLIINDVNKEGCMPDYVAGKVAGGGMEEGQLVHTNLNLDHSIFAEAGTHFSVNANGETVGAGVIINPSRRPNGQAHVSLMEEHLDHAKPESSARKPESGKPAERFANVVLQDLNGAVLDAGSKIEPRQLFTMNLSIRELKDKSLVQKPHPIDENLPKGQDLSLKVVVSSSDFDLGLDETPKDECHIVQSLFLLPADGGAAKASDGKEDLAISVRAPAAAMTAHLRINYYFRNHPVQSQLLTAEIGAEKSAVNVELDFSFSSSLADLETLPQRPQMSLFTHTGEEKGHTLMIQDKSENNLLTPVLLNFDKANINGIVKKFRSALEDYAPGDHKVTKAMLIRAMQNLAPVGQELYDSIIPANYKRVLRNCLKGQKGFVVQITRPISDDWTIPWGWIYDINLDPDLDPSDIPVCQCIKDWDEKSPLILDPDHHPLHTANVLCPLGFWAFRYSVEILSNEKIANLSNISLSGDFNIVAAVNSSLDWKDHITTLETIFQKKYPECVMKRATSKDQIQACLGVESADQNILAIYFICHGDKETVGDPNTYLVVGQNEKLTTKKLGFWFESWDANWETTHPLVFINACHSVEIQPNTYSSFQREFIGQANAAGVVGTEVKVNEKIAKEFAQSFFASLVNGGSVGQSLQQAKMDYLRQGNLIGLNYTSYCWSDLRINVR